MTGMPDGIAGLKLPLAFFGKGGQVFLNNVFTVPTTTKHCRPGKYVHEQQECFSLSLKDVGLSRGRKPLYWGKK
jgi:hypothetical protein